MSGSDRVGPKNLPAPVAERVDRRASTPTAARTPPTISPFSRLRKVNSLSSCGSARHQLFGDGEDLGEQRKHDGLKADEDRGRGVEQRVDVERDAADGSRSGQKPQSRRDAERAAAPSRDRETASAGCTAAGIAGAASRRASCADAADGFAHPATASPAPRRSSCRTASP